MKNKNGKIITIVQVTLMVYDYDYCYESSNYSFLSVYNILLCAKFLYALSHLILITSL